MTTYSNPRMLAVIENWPSGQHRVTATFVVETHPKRGQRAVRTTTGAPKLGVYAPAVRIVDGDDGKTYIASLTIYGTISVMCGDMKSGHELVYETDPRYAETRKAIFR